MNNQNHWQGISGIRFHDYTRLDLLTNGKESDDIRIYFMHRKDGDTLLLVLGLKPAYSVRSGQAGWIAQDLLWHPVSQPLRRASGANLTMPGCRNLHPGPTVAQAAS
jgi:hypothetical protein